MAISYPLQLPTSIGIADITIRANNASAISVSPFSFKSQTLHWGGEMWSATVSIPPCKREVAAQWYSFLVSLRGHVGTFYLGDPNGTSPQGTGGGNPRVRGGSQTGYTLAISTDLDNQISYLKSGDWIQVGGGSNRRLHMVTADVDTGGAGNADVEIWPALRESPANDLNINLNNVEGVFRLASNSVEFNINSISSYGISFECIEVV